MDQIGEDSEWQRGPSFLQSDRECWPISETGECTVPDDELLPRHRVVNSVQSIRCHSLRDTVKSIFKYSNNYHKNLRILARYLAASRDAAKEKGGWPKETHEERILDAMARPLTGEDIERARKIAFLAFQDEVTEVLNSPPVNRSKNHGKRSTGKLEKEKKINLASLSPFRHEGIWCTQGRYGSELGRVLGPERLPILPATSRLAVCIMNSAHGECHRGGADSCFRSRGIAWILRARALADKVAADCPKCPILWKTKVEQRLANLPEERTRVNEKPWTSVAIDLFGPYKIRVLPHNRNLVKVWPIVFGCMNTGALHVEVAGNYGADAFLQAYTCFTSVRGAPSKVYTDKGSQLTRASTNVTESAENWDWSKVEDSTSKDSTTWRFTPPASQWRNGLAESRVRCMKEGLDLMMPAGAENLSFTEFQTVIKKICNSINDRPLAVKRSGDKNDGEIMPITPNSLLLGRTSVQPQSLVDIDEEDKLVKRMKFVEEVEREWWKLWFSTVFKDMFVRNSWKQKSENLRPGDICMKGYSSSLGKERYVLCRVDEVHPDEEGLVRTVTVLSRPRDSREKSLPYKTKLLVREKMSVQRLVLICRDENIPEDPVLDAPSSSTAGSTTFPPSSVPSPLLTSSIIDVSSSSSTPVTLKSQGTSKTLSSKSGLSGTFPDFSPTQHFSVAEISEVSEDDSFEKPGQDTE